MFTTEFGSNFWAAKESQVQVLVGKLVFEYTMTKGHAEQEL